jgi:hypothetical protein
MVQCSKCKEFADRFNIENLNEYQSIVRRLIDLAHAGTFVLIQAACPLQDMLGTPLPGDVVSHTFKCTNCGRGFSLSIDTFHGGAHWTPQDDRPLP